MSLQHTAGPCALTALHEDAHRPTSSPDAVDLPEKEQRSEPLRLCSRDRCWLPSHTDDALKSLPSRAPDARSILKASQKNGEQLQRQILDVWMKTFIFGKAMGRQEKVLEEKAHTGRKGL